MLDPLHNKLHEFTKIYNSSQVLYGMCNMYNSKTCQRFGKTNLKKQS